MGDIINSKNLCKFQEHNFFDIILHYKQKMQQTATLKEQELKMNENFQDEEDQYEEETIDKGKLNEKLLAAVKKNQIEEVQKCLKRKADINYEENTKKKWNSLIWASCQGYTALVKLLIAKGAAQQYLDVKLQNRHVPLGLTKQLKPNPLHWASFKNHLEIVEILLKTGLHWEDVDGAGNNSVMLCASAGATDIFKIYLQIGVTLDDKNSRGHTVKDLTTDTQILRLVIKHQNSKQCALSKQPFKEKDIKYWCWVCDNFVSKEQHKMQWVLRNLNAVQKQKIDGRCTACWQQSNKIRNQLQNAINIYDQNNLASTIKKYKNKHNEIQILFLQECLKISHKLSTQNNILNYIKTLSKIQDYRIILKSVNKIKKLLKFLEAEPIQIDQNVINTAEREIQRLNAERDLRFEIDNIDTSVATREGVAKLEEVYNKAQERGVAPEYLEVADEIKSKMKRSILAQDLFQNFNDYPQRPDPYPQPLVIDFKTKKPLDPQTKKPTDPANLIPKKKKGRKAPVFQIPQWAENLNDMNDRIKELQELIGVKQELGLSEEFCGKANEVIALMKRESRYRKDMNTLQTMVDEQTKKKK